MKCPECGRNQLYKDGMVCRCGYAFTLDPKNDKFTDGRMMGLIRGASGNGTYYYTKNQLFAQFCRKNSKSPLPLFITGLCLFAIGLISLIFWGLTFLAVVPPFIGFMFLIGAATTYGEMPTRGRFNELFKKWKKEKAHTLDKMLTQPSLHEPPPEWQEPDIYDYGVERILIVERDLLVDLFVKNGLHAETRSLIISQNNYPPYLMDRAKSLLEAQPDLPVMLLHDSTRDGLRMEGSLRAKDTLPLADREIIDLGMSQEDAKNLKRLKPMKPKNDDYHVPVDMLGYGLLAAGVSAGLIESMAFADLIAQQGTSHADTTSNFG